MKKEEGKKMGHSELGAWKAASLFLSSQVQRLL
jgi:hypothetical protein